jgi:predicted deacylase
MSALDPNKYPIELPFPDITAYRVGNTGIDYYTSFDSGVAGPHVLINALVHGNEVCGVIALQQLFDSGLRPLRGKLTLGFSNVEAYQAFDPAQPMASRFVDEDMNRVWDLATLAGDRHSCELERARQIRPLIDTVDVMLDLHSMQHKTDPVIVAGPLDKSVAMSRQLGTPSVIVADTGHAAGCRLRDYGGFGDAARDQTAVLVECGQHWEAGAARVALDCTYRWLLIHGMINAEVAEPHLQPLPARQRVVRVETPVTVQTEHFTFAQPFTGLEVLEKGALIGVDGDTEVRAPHDGCVLIMPSRRLTPGATAVRLGRYEV